ncbi:phage virion morphogenesis protein [Algimonas porphyrae]|uniref:Mu phage tail completion protein GpG n=1 Tax=Algimonas porphyrae TaxID=1128113 RepID=A0ABQ5V094_9PROT|nr:phage virion morphogenesis protein [Algimonas porphyrae]GLQ20502.1 Mu phage tail completion protein GpG [Algimonas porphyrae]
MSAVALHIDLAEIELASARLDAIASKIDVGALLSGVTGIVESQTRRRITDEKRAPDGTPWADWSPAYAETRHGGHSLLQGRGDYLDSIFGEVRGDVGVVGSPLIYAAMHQLGGDFQAFGRHAATMPARPAFGLSPADETEILEVVSDYLNGLDL